MDYSPPGSSVHGTLQQRLLEWAAMPSSRGYSGVDEMMIIQKSLIQFSLLTGQQDDCLLFIKWKCIIMKIFILIVFTLSRLRKKAWSYCLRGDTGGRSGGCGRGGRRDSHSGCNECFYRVPIHLPPCAFTSGPVSQNDPCRKRSQKQSWTIGTLLPDCLIPICFLALILFFFYSFFVWLIDLPALGLSCSAWDFCCIMRDLPLQQLNSLVAVCKLSCSTACGILVSQAGIEPISPALQGRFLTTGPPGKSPGTASSASSSLYCTGTKHSSPSSCLLLIPLVWCLLLLFRH